MKSVLLLLPRRSNSLNKQDLSFLADKSRHNTRRVLFFSLFCAYAFLAVLGTSDYDILLKKPIVIPGLRITLPLLSFYIVIPAVIVALHFGVLWMHKFCQIELEYRSPEKIKKIPFSIFDAIYVEKNNIWLKICVTFLIYFFPLITLITFFIQFAKFQNFYISFWHAFLAWLDLLIISVLIFPPRKWLEITPPIFGLCLVIALIVFNFVLKHPSHYSRDTLLAFHFPHLEVTHINLNEKFDINEAKAYQELDGNQTKKPYLFYITKQNLRNRYLILANLSHTKMVNFDFRGAKLIGANLEGSQLQYSFFSGADLSGATLKHCDLKESIFDRANLQRANLYSANLQSTDLISANLQGANLILVNFQDAALSSANLQRADLESANLRGADLTKAKLQGTNLDLTKLQGTNLYSANLQGANLNSTDAQGINLRSANLQGANLRSANMQGANLRSANMQGANLHSAKLQGANLQSANLQGANLTEAKLQGANLIKAKLQGVNLHDSLLQGTYLYKTKLQGVFSQANYYRFINLINHKAEFFGFSNITFTKKDFKKLKIILNKKYIIKRSGPAAPKLIAVKINGRIYYFNKTPTIEERLNLLQKAIGKTSLEWLNMQKGKYSAGVLTWEEACKIQQEVTYPEARKRMGLDSVNWDEKCRK